MQRMVHSHKRSGALCWRKLPNGRNCSSNTHLACSGRNAHVGSPDLGELLQLEGCHTSQQASCCRSVLRQLPCRQILHVRGIDKVDDYAICLHMHGAPGLWASSQIQALLVRAVVFLAQALCNHTQSLQQMAELACRRKGPQRCQRDSVTWPLFRACRSYKLYVMQTVAMMQAKASICNTYQKQRMHLKVLQHAPKIGVRSCICYEACSI